MQEVTRRDQRHRDQPSLFDSPVLSRPSDPATSHQSAAEVSGRLTTLQLCLLEAVQEANQLGIEPTANEAAAAASLQHGRLAESYRKRAKELVRDGLIRATGSRVCNVTGSVAQVYREASS